MDDVKRLLEQFADRAVDGLPPVDVEADVARGRRALRRIKTRRRATGVLCIAAATTAVLVAGDQARWWDGGETEVATDPAAPEASSAPPPTASAPPTDTASTSAAPETMSMFSDTAVRLTANRQSWNGISCTLAPQGWAAQPAPDRVVLMAPTARTADVSAQLELFGSDRPESLSGIRAFPASGKVIHVGTADGREIGQVRLGERWLVARLPAGAQDWTDDTLRRFLDSCTLS